MCVIVAESGLVCQQLCVCDCCLERFDLSAVVCVCVIVA